MTDRIDGLIRDRISDDVAEARKHMPLASELGAEAHRRRRRRTVRRGAGGALAILAIASATIALNTTSGSQSNVVADTTNNSMPNETLPTYTIRDGVALTRKDVLLDGVLSFTDQGCPFMGYETGRSQPLAFPAAFELTGEASNRQIVDASGEVWGVEGQQVIFGAISLVEGQTRVEGLCGARDTTDLGILAVAPD